MSFLECAISPNKASSQLPAHNWTLHKWQVLKDNHYRANDRNVVESSLWTIDAKIIGSTIFENRAQPDRNGPNVAGH